MQEELLRAFCARLNTRFWEEVWRRRMAAYRRRPEAFAEEVLGSRWWEAQAEVARTVAAHRRTVVKSANGVGKTYLAADLALWFLYTHRPSVVLTTAPTWRQVRYLLWEEIRRRFRGARVPLPGMLRLTQLTVGEGWFALGLATDEGVRFQGFHAENLLILMDEASGIPEEIWEAVEGVAVGRNNRILAIGNPLSPSGRFYRLFRAASRWQRRTISALEHPNVRGRGRQIPGAVTAEAISERVAEWCEPVERKEVYSSADLFEWQGGHYRPNGIFRARVLGEFPDSEEEALIPRRWIEAAMERTLPAEGYRRAAVDVARLGGDLTVIGLRVGPVVTHLEAVRGADLMEVCGRIVRLAYEERPESIAIDSIGLGAGVVDRLNELQIAGVEAVNVALPANDRERFANRRAELYWGLRERFRRGEIALPRNETLCEQLASLRYGHTSGGKIQIESKEAMRRRGMDSPDHADMLALLFDDAAESLLGVNPGSVVVGPSMAEVLRGEMEGW